MATLKQVNVMKHGITLSPLADPIIFLGFVSVILMKSQASLRKLEVAYVQLVRWIASTEPFISVTSLILATLAPFTWPRNHSSEGRIHIRLELTNNAWRSLFPGSIVHHVAMTTSDHSLISVHLQCPRPRKIGTRPLFHFEAMWLQDPRCPDVVQDAWYEGLYKPDGVPITNFLASCLELLTRWNKKDFGHVGKQIERLDKKLQLLE